MHSFCHCICSFFHLLGMRKHFCESNLMKPLMFSMVKCAQKITSNLMFASYFCNYYLFKVTTLQKELNENQLSFRVSRRLNICAASM